MGEYDDYGVDSIWSTQEKALEYYNVQRQYHDDIHEPYEQAIDEFSILDIDIFSTIIIKMDGEVREVYQTSKTPLDRPPVSIGLHYYMSSPTINEMVWTVVGDVTKPPLFNKNVAIDEVKAIWSQIMARGLWGKEKETREAFP